MNRKRLKELMPIMQAYLDGKTIQYKSSVSGWVDVDNPSWSEGYRYRVKPEKKVFKGWVNVHANGDGYLYSSKDIADAGDCGARIACIYIEKEYEEGEGLCDT